MTSRSSDTAMRKAPPPTAAEIRPAPPDLDIAGLMQRKSRGQIAATQAPAIPGGHKYVCSTCGGPRVHATELFAPGEPISRKELQNLILQRDGTRVEIRISKTQEQPSTKARIAIICRSCGATHVLTYEGEGRWMPEAFAKRVNRQIGKRRKNLRETFESSLKAVLEKPPVPELVEPESADDDQDINELLDSIRHGEDAGRESDGHATPLRGSLGAKAPAAMREASPAAAKPTSSPKPKPKKWSRRTKARVLGLALSAPFLFMGALYVLAWRGTYIWPIYYAIQPYWRDWMSAPWFWGASLYVPAVVAAIYAWRFHNREDILDRRPEGPSQEPRKRGTMPGTKDQAKNPGKFKRPKWLDEG